MVRLYCGDSNRLPNGYDGFGSRDTCLQTGFGVGRAKGSGPWKFDKYKRKYATLILVSVLVAYGAFMELRERMNSTQAYNVSLAVGTLSMFAIFFYMFIYGRSYCGKSNILPKMYYSFGSKNSCLKRGIGLGMHKDNVPPFIFVFVVMISIILASVTFSQLKMEESASFFISTFVGFVSLAIIYSALKRMFV